MITGTFAISCRYSSRWPRDAGSLSQSSPLATAGALKETPRLRTETIFTFQSLHPVRRLPGGMPEQCDQPAGGGHPH
jgi:hypothetical protein